MLFEKGTQFDLSEFMFRIVTKFYASRYLPSATLYASLGLAVETGKFLNPYLVALILDELTAHI